MAELSWSVSAMNDATERLRKASGRDLPEALALVSEAVWWINLVEATVIRTSQAACDQALANLGPAERGATEGTFAGLRFVRNWLGYHADPADFIQPGQNEDGGEVPVTAWTWTFLPAPELGEMSPRNRQAGAVRYRQYCNTWPASRSARPLPVRSRSSTTSPRPHNWQPVARGRSQPVRLLTFPIAVTRKLQPSPALP